MRKTLIALALVLFGVSTAWAGTVKRTIRIKVLVPRVQGLQTRVTPLSRIKGERLGRDVYRISSRVRGNVKDWKMIYEVSGARDWDVRLRLVGGREINLPMERKVSFSNEDVPAEEMEMFLTHLGNRALRRGGSPVYVQMTLLPN